MFTNQTLSDQYNYEISQVHNIYYELLEIYVQVSVCLDVVKTNKRP